MIRGSHDRYYISPQDHVLVEFRRLHRSHEHRPGRVVLSQGHRLILSETKLGQTSPIPATGHANTIATQLLNSHCTPLPKDNEVLYIPTVVEVMMCNTSLLNAESIRIRGDSNVPQRILQSCSLQSDEDVRLAVSELVAFVEGGGAMEDFLDIAVSVCNALSFVVSGKPFLLLV